MISNDAFNAVLDLDLDPIKVKLMHKASGEGWSVKKANAVETEYRRFLYLMKMFPNEQTAPLADVDTFWHYHILDTLKYATDCEQAFGYFLHHFPYIGMRGGDDEAVHSHSAERMRELYEATFGDRYARAAGAFCGSPGAGSAFCGAGTAAARLAPQRPTLARAPGAAQGAAQATLAPGSALPTIRARNSRMLKSLTSCMRNRMVAPIGRVR